MRGRMAGGCRRTGKSKEFGVKEGDWNGEVAARVLIVLCVHGVGGG